MVVVTVRSRAGGRLLGEKKRFVLMIERATFVVVCLLQGGMEINTSDFFLLESLSPGAPGFYC